MDRAWSTASSRIRLLIGPPRDMLMICAPLSAAKRMPSATLATVPKPCFESTFTGISRDGPLNLYNAIRTAATPAAKGKGVMVLLNDEINAARDVTKTNTERVNTFESRDLGPIGPTKGLSEKFRASLWSRAP